MSEKDQAEALKLLTEWVERAKEGALLLPASVRQQQLADLVERTQKLLKL